MSCPPSPLVLLPPVLVPPCAKTPSGPSGRAGAQCSPSCYSSRIISVAKALAFPVASHAWPAETWWQMLRSTPALPGAWPSHPPHFWVARLPRARSEQSHRAHPRWWIYVSWVSGDPDCCRELRGTGGGRGPEGATAGHIWCCPTASSPGEAVWWGQGTCTAWEQLSGHKYQPDDSAASLPVPRAGSSYAGGYLPAHKVPGSWCWVLNPLRQHLLLVSQLGGGRLGQGARCLAAGLGLA